MKTTQSLTQQYINANNLINRYFSQTPLQKSMYYDGNIWNNHHVFYHDNIFLIATFSRRDTHWKIIDYFNLLTDIIKVQNFHSIIDIFPLINNCLDNYNNVPFNNTARNSDIYIAYDFQNLVTSYLAIAHDLDEDTWSSFCINQHNDFKMQEWHQIQGKLVYTQSNNRSFYNRQTNKMNILLNNINMQDAFYTQQYNLIGFIQKKSKKQDINMYSFFQTSDYLKKKLYQIMRPKIMSIMLQAHLDWYYNRTSVYCFLLNAPFIQGQNNCFILPVYYLIDVNQNNKQFASHLQCYISYKLCYSLHTKITIFQTNHLTSPAIKKTISL